jgi:heptosyltransferase-3
LSKRVLVYRLGSLGDTVVALPAWHVVRRAFPEATFTLLTNKPIAAKAAAVEAVLGERAFVEVINYPIGTRNPLELITLRRVIRNGRFDVVVNLCEARTKLRTLRDRLFFRLCGLKDLRGFPSEDADFHPVLDPSTGLFESETKRLLRRVGSLGTSDLQDPASWDLELTSDERAAAARLPEGQTPVLALGVGTKMQAKDWGEDNWLNLVQRLTSALPGWRLVIVGSSDESQRAEMCCSLWSGPRANLCGALSPRESAALLERAEVFVGHDSGPMHLASALGTPCVAIFSARDLPGRWFPARPGHKILYHKTDCFGCGLEECIVERKKCILSISVGEVYAAVLDLLDRKGFPRPDQSKHS